MVISLWVQIFFCLLWHGITTVSSVWDVFEFSGIAVGAGFDDSGDHDIAYRRIFAFGSRDSC